MTSAKTYKDALKGEGELAGWSTEMLLQHAIRTILELETQLQRARENSERCGLSAGFVAAINAYEMTVQELSDIAGFPSPSILYGMKNGARFPVTPQTRERLQKLADFIGFYDTMFALQD